MLADFADRCCDLWLTPDSGIWELAENAALHDLEDGLLGRARPGGRADRAG